MRLRVLTAIALTVPLALSACGGDDDTSGAGGTTGKGGTAGKGGGAGMAGASGEGGEGGAGRGGTSATGGSGGSGGTGRAGTGGSTGGAGMGMMGEAGAGEAGEAGMAGAGTRSFRVQIENLSGSASTPTPFSPGVWVVGDAEHLLFTPGQAAPDNGLEAQAEQGSPAALADALDEQSHVSAFGLFDTPQNASNAGPIAPGQSYEWTVSASPDGGMLAFASMFGQSNDTFLGTQDGGIPLFDEDGEPLPERDVTDSVRLWNAGTERDQAPGMGPDQAPRQASADAGAAEGTIARFNDTTRALPAASAIVDVSVTESNGTFTIQLQNISGDEHAIDTPISPVFYATHDDSWSLFTTGEPAPDGLEGLAEDGAPAALVTASTGAEGVGTAAAVTTPDGAASAGAAPTGSSFTFQVTPDEEHPFLSFASMVGTTNDAFLALPPAGVRLLDDQGDPRDAEDVQADIMDRLSVWDAGTEANEVPGIGANQAPRQPAANTGPADPNAQVRRYADSTNDLADDALDAFVNVTITHTTGNDFMVTIADTAGGTPFPGNIAPLAWALHDDSTSLFEPGGHASDGLELLAEDGDPSQFASELDDLDGVGSSGVVDTPQGAAGAAALTPGDSYVFTVTPDASHRFLGFAAMVAPTNDTFLAFEPSGVALLDASGNVRTDTAIADDVAASLHAWDAGTEANEAGAAGPDQVGRTTVNTGPAEGDGTVREQDDPVWPYPPVEQLVKVTIQPL